MFFGSGEKTYKQIKNLNKIPENQSFLVFLFLKKLGSLNSLFYLKRVTSCGSRNRTCVVELMRLSWCLLQSTPPYHINSERATDSQKGWLKSYYIVRFTLDLFSEFLFVTITVAVICFTYTWNAKESRSHFPHIQQ